jgi:hypothetical protein
MNPRTQTQKAIDIGDPQSRLIPANPSGTAAPARAPVEPEIVGGPVSKARAASLEEPATPISNAVPAMASVPVTDRASLFDREVADDFQARWNEIQVGFVDDPRASVERADGLVSEVTRCLTESFVSGRRRLESEWEKGGDASTEALRLTLQHYHSFFNRLLTL